MPNGGSWESKFVPIGARVGRTGLVFETDGRAGLGGLVVKLFTWAAGLPAQVVQEFTREAMRVAHLHHPHVAQVLDAGRLGDGTPFVVMERLDGMTLDEAASGRSLPLADVLPVLRGVGSALGAAHAAGVAHRELRADNIFIADLGRSGTGCPKLLDFGVARLGAGAHAIGRGAEELGGRAGERADQLALATLASRLLDPISAPAQRVLLRAMRPDPSQRFASVTALVEALEEALVSGTAAGLTANAATLRTFVGATIPFSPSRLAPTVVAAPSVLVAARPPTSPPTPARASSPSSLTQQFFADGDQLEKEHAAGQTSDAGTTAERDEEDDLETAAASRVPRSYAQIGAAALLALGSVAVITWTIVSLASKPAGGPLAANASPAAMSPAGTLRLAGATERGPGAKMIAVRRAPRMQPPPFAASDVPVPSRLAAAPPMPAAHSSPTPSAASSPAPLADVVDQAPAQPSASAPAAEAAPRSGDQAPPLPSEAPAKPNDDDQPQPGEQEDGDPHAATPAPSAPREPAPAPGASGDVPPAPSAPEVAAPSAPAP